MRMRQNDPVEGVTTGFEPFGKQVFTIWPGIYLAIQTVKLGDAFHIHRTIYSTTKIECTANVGTVSVATPLT